jgi:hypothetical protein
MASSSDCWISDVEFTRSRDSRVERNECRTRRTGAPSDLLADLATGWYLGSVAMVAFAVIVLASWLEARGKRPAGRTAAPTIALAYFAFGLLVFLFRSFNRHFLIAFVIPGALLGVAVMKSRWAGPR